MAHPKQPEHREVRAFEVNDEVSSWKLSVKDWLEHQGRDKEWDGIATACLVFNHNDQLLVIQRASHDSLPNKWEMPGGAADEEDVTILHAAARELWEESGLTAKRFVDVITTNSDRSVGELFKNRAKTKTWCRFTFLVEVESDDHVTLDPNEHQDYVWASEDNIRQQKIGERDLTLTKESVSAVILEAFRMRRKRNGAL